MFHLSVGKCYSKKAISHWECDSSVHLSGKGDHHEETVDGKVRATRGLSRINVWQWNQRCSRVYKCAGIRKMVSEERVLH